MSDDEDNIYFCGTPLEPYDEDAFPKRKPITLEEQVAKDAQGRRRFHGAFTGGFSAGFFNTVGSLEGWTPSEFKSTRQDKAKGFMQKPEDFMDEEDTGEYGIAPRTIKATKDYSTVKKRPRQVFTDGPIPGVPVLDTILTSGNETVGYLLLRNMGIEDKVKKQQEELSSSGNSKVYGCEMPTQCQISKDISGKEYQIPVLYKEFLDNPKSNTFGLGYEGLAKPHINLFQSTNLVFRDKNDKQISIGGKAFGVGAFEEEDDDIYVKDDMSNYDFELTKEKQPVKKEYDNEDLLFGMFKQSTVPLIPKKLYPPPSIPHSFSGIHKVRKSRFEPIKEDPDGPKGRINPAIRAKYLGEEVEETHTPSRPVLEPVKAETDCDTSKNSKPEFDVSSILSDRFVTASQEEDIGNILEPVKKSEITHGTKEMRDAAGMKMFGPLTRISTDWHPCAVLCKRFNVPEPLLDRPEERNKKRTKNLIFEYQKHTDDEPTLKPGISTDPSTPEPLRSTPEPMIQEQTQFEEPETVKVEKTEELKEETSNSPKDITEKIGVEDKLDLYRAVFLSSSESEEEEEELDKIKEENKEEEDKTEEFKSSILSEELLPKIKPLKEGILSNLDFGLFNRSKNKPPDDVKTITIDTSSDNKTSLSYGPQLPAQREEIKELTAVSTVLSDSEDEWVEKDEHSKKKNKHKKKEKKEKHRKYKHEKRKSKR